MNEMTEFEDGHRRVVIDLSPTLTNRQVIDVFTVALAQSLNLRGVDGTEMAVPTDPDLFREPEGTC